MNKMKMLLASAAVSAISATAASAVVIDFGQDTVEPGLPSIVVTASGYTITATGTGRDGSGKVVAANVTQTGAPVNGKNQGGFGVKSPNDSDQGIDGGIGGDEIYKDTLRLTFNTAVNIAGVSFSLVNDQNIGGVHYADNASVSIDGGPAMSFDIDQFGWPSFMATGGWVGTVFDFSALGQLDSYKLRAVDVTPVPVPPAALLLATGVAGIGALARRKARKS